MRNLVNLIKRHILVLCAFVMLASCNKDPEEIVEPPKIDVEDPTASVPMEFDARLKENKTFKVGDTVKFIVDGNANMISFYSGTVGNDYAYHNTERFYDVIAKLSFESNKTPDNNTISNIDCAELLYSTDFNGTYTYENIKNTNWKPITNRFALQTTLQASSTTYAASGNVDISHVFAEGKPVYFAWLCKTQAASNRVQFRLRNFILSGEVVEDNTLSKQLFSQGQFGFQWYENPASAAQASNNRPTVTSTLLTWNGVFNNMTGPYKEGYAVSGPIELPQYNVGKDMPAILITKQDKNELEHKYVYTTPGNYEVVFIASNTHANVQPEIIKKVNITIEP